MSKDPWMELEKAIRDQLELQVRLSFARHHGFMLKHGLAQCRHVADIGTGNGLFLAQVAQRHPPIEFLGVDDKAHMVEEAKSRPEKNVTWLQADALDESVQAALAKSDGVLMRYFVLHMPGTGFAIPKILAGARPGTRLWIFDLDSDYTLCEPGHEAFDSFQDIVRAFCERNSVEIRTKSMLPPILEAAGFQVAGAAVEPFTNREIESGLFAEYLFREAALYRYFLEGARDSERLRLIRDFLFNVMNSKTHFVRYGMVMLAAVKTSRRPAAALTRT